MSRYIPINAQDALDKLKAKKKQISIGLATIAALLILFFVFFTKSSEIPECQDCKSYGPLKPAYKGSLDLIFENKDYQLSVIEKLAGAIRIPTQIYDETPPPDLSIPLKDDPNYKNFSLLHTYLESTFPLVYSKFIVEKINGAGLLLTWHPKHIPKDSKPFLLMAHQDVVPFDPSTVSRWTYPPFSGHYDKKTDTLYGRGSTDTKKLLISHLEALELLIAANWEPSKRPILLSYGFDEERGGIDGASAIAKFILERYGPDSIYGLIDEGGETGYLGDNGFIGSPVTAEKGYLDAIITLNTKGGHSSIPPDHTSIGIISELNYLLEKNPYDPSIAVNNPALEAVQCRALYDKSFFGDVTKGFKSGRLGKLTNAVNNHLGYRYFFRTSQAIDIIKGGVKANALPEQVTVLVNNRININSSVNETLVHILDLVSEVADKYDLSIKLERSSNASELKSGKNGEFVVVVRGELEPAPISPTAGDEMWEIIAGTIVNTYSSSFFGNNTEVYVAPSLTTGNTDTKYFWDLTKRIYRFSGSLHVNGSNAHTVDEKTTGKSIISCLAFVYQIIGNIDKYT
ncbi:related to Carboxypeptidase S [Saccharomycodes ludwigii]|uniref:Related to Carboxypeptidase S n=1 Tax=Saccharomycodes ludwigii TaxID=36035 RepID=A0A376B8G7_9ASCO|nr:related to Carboxypeptidase S [Saccharomycodes ludwigii]